MRMGPPNPTGKGQMAFAQTLGFGTKPPATGGGMQVAAAFFDLAHFSSLVLIFDHKFLPVSLHLK